MTFLPPRQMRQLILMPSQERVDFRAACFCHKRIIDVGYVCSVCLSSAFVASERCRPIQTDALARLSSVLLAVFCKPTPVCSTCKTKFPLKTLQALGAGMPKPGGGARKSRPTSRGASPALARVAGGGGNGAQATGSPLASNEPIIIDDD
jgi:transcription initiation factor TFIIH subunit 3